jgi:AcrR family transcriptional regulator
LAEEAGVSAAALVQRFGSKRALLLATAADAGGGSHYIFAGLRAQHHSPVAPLLGMGECMTMMGSTREALPIRSRSCSSTSPIPTSAGMPSPARAACAEVCVRW